MLHLYLIKGKKARYQVYAMQFDYILIWFKKSTRKTVWQEAIVGAGMNSHSHNSNMKSFKRKSKSKSQSTRVKFQQ